MHDCSTTCWRSGRGAQRWLVGGHWQQGVSHYVYSFWVSVSFLLLFFLVCVRACVFLCVEPGCCTSSVTCYFELFLVSPCKDDVCFNSESPDVVNLRNTYGSRCRRAKVPVHRLGRTGRAVIEWAPRAPRFTVHRQLQPGTEHRNSLPNHHE